jgi:MscS family membrane protein
MEPMPLLKENRREISKSLYWTCALRLTLSILLFASSAAHSPGQLSTSRASPAKAERATPVDPFGRETPRSTAMGLLKYGERRDFETAAHYLQPTPGQDTHLVERARELQGLHAKFKGNIDLLSDEPNGSVEAGLPPGEVHAGVIRVGATTVDVILVRVNDPDSGKIWLISKDTVARIPELYAQMKSEGLTTAERFVPAALTSRHLLDMSLAQWIGWLLSIPISWFLAWLLEFLLSAPRRI